MKNWLGYLVGGVLLIVGLLFVWEGVPHTSSVTCKRTAENQINCLQQEKVLWWIPIQKTLLNNLQAVHLSQGENAYDGTVYLIYLRGANNNLMFGNSLDLEEVQEDILKAKQFIKDSKAQSLTLKRYEVNWIFTILGSLIGALGFWIVIYDIVDRKSKE
ncbi:MAG TPA: hypothetical protein DDZ80_32855 [Cyanobacteria bacterium UBA8803]|nr:hypothetical protein [Cyanobacteria bacterium UBA9273]HBL62987.1 hypothetical protein [Cyanobacteria bacterium UBA8803]